jgi:hypothetical protein
MLSGEMVMAGAAPAEQNSPDRSQQYFDANEQQD